MSPRVAASQASAIGAGVGAGAVDGVARRRAQRNQSASIGLHPRQQSPGAAAAPRSARPAGAQPVEPALLPGRIVRDEVEVREGVGRRRHRLGGRCRRPAPSPSVMPCTRSALRPTSPTSGQSGRGAISVEALRTASSSIQAQPISIGHESGAERGGLEVEEERAAGTRRRRARGQRLPGGSRSSPGMTSPRSPSSPASSAGSLTPDYRRVPTSAV